MCNVKNTWKEIKLLINGKSRADNVILLLSTLEIEDYHIMLIRYPISWTHSIHVLALIKLPEFLRHKSIFLASCQSMPGPLSLNPSPLLKLKPKSCLYHFIMCTDCILVWKFWNVPAKSSRALYANLLTIQLQLGPTHRNSSMPVYKGEDKTDLVTIVISLYSLFSIEFSKETVYHGFFGDK